jgi:transposase
VIIMETIAKIRRLYYVNGKGFKTIARELRLSKNTVKRVIRADKTEQSYQRNHQSYRVLGNYTEGLTEKLTFDVSEPKRRRRTAKKLYVELKAQGYQGSYDAVQKFVLRWRKQRGSPGLGKAFVPLDFALGEAFEFDFSEEEIELSGVMTRIKVAHIRLCYSRYFLLIAYPNEQLEMVLDGHNEGFRFFGGVCRKGIYDNPKTVVKTILVGKEREFNPRFLQMCSHHLFEPIACTPSAPWEKGQVENQVRTSRMNFFSPLVKVNSLDELNLQLQSACLLFAKQMKHPLQKDKTVFEVYEQERPGLLSYRGDFDSYQIRGEVVSPYSLVCYATNCYSVPCTYVGQVVQVRIYAKRIVIVHQGQVVGSHARCFERHQRLYDPWHYVPLLERKPGALRNGAPFKQWVLPDTLQRVRERLSRYRDSDKQFIRILLQVMTHGLSKVEQACAFALTQGGCNDTMILRYLEPRPKPPTHLSSVWQLSFPPTGDCQPYNQAYLSKKMWVQEVRYGS